MQERAAAARRNRESEREGKGGRVKAEKKGCVKGSRDGCGGEKSDGDGESEDAKDGRGVQPSALAERLVGQPNANPTCERHGAPILPK